jgi:serine/threonine-protein kinase
MGHELDSTVASYPIRADGGSALEALEVPAASRYTEGTELGVGGMGRVLLARDARIGRDVALKALHPARELEPQERARFLREAQVQGQLEHPSIVPVYDIDRRADGTTFFTMRRVRGHTLAAIIEEARAGEARYTQRELLTAFATVCLAVDYAHSRGVVHRDLKPANIMLGDFGEVYVLDWGLARLVDEAGKSKDEPTERLSMPGSFLGTPMYMAPEQMADPDVGPAADVFSLGLILFEILTLERARDPGALFAPIDARISVRAPQRIVAPELETICIRATAFEAEDRYPSARALQEAINRYLEGDRELAQRKQLASEHAKNAREALAAGGVQDRARAMKELVRALALDPAANEQVAMLNEILATPPKQLPEEVREQLRAETQSMIRRGSRHSVAAMLSWFLFFPVLLWIGIRDAWAIATIAIPVASAAVLSALSLRQRHIGPGIQYAVIACMLAAAAGLSRLYGPFVLMPTMVATYTIVLQAHPSGRFRMVSALLAVAALAVPVILEATGVLPTAYVFEHGTWTILPQIIELPPRATVTFLTLANIAMVVVPCMFISRLRADLSSAQQHQAIQAWHFRRVAADLVGVE